MSMALRKSNDSTTVPAPARARAAMMGMKRRSPSARRNSTSLRAGPGWSSASTAASSGGRACAGFPSAKPDTLKASAPRKSNMGCPSLLGSAAGRAVHRVSGTSSDTSPFPVSSNRWPKARAARLRATTLLLTRRSVARAQASSAHRGRHPPPAAAVAMRAPASVTPSFRKRRRNGSRKPGSRVHAAKSATGNGISCTYRSRTRSALRIQRRPRPGSMTWTHGPSTRHTTTKWVKPDGSLTTTKAGRVSASRRRTCSTGIIICVASRPKDLAKSSRVSMDDPSTVV
jgi:hypothetical protein